MKKILLSLLIALSIVGQSVAQEEYDESNKPTHGWLVVKNGVSIQTGYSENESPTSLTEIKWLWSRFAMPKGYLIVGGLDYMPFWTEYGERRDPAVPDGYVYFPGGGEMEGPTQRIYKDGLKKVQLSSYIPLVYGNGKAHKAENGMSFKIVPFKSSAKVKIEYTGIPDIDSGIKRFLKSQKCYLLMIMSSAGKVEHVELLEKTSKGFTAFNNYFRSVNEPKVNTQGLLTTQWKFGYDEMGTDVYWTWVKDENALVGVFGMFGDDSVYLIPFLKVVK